MIAILFFIAWFLTGCASWKQVSCYNSDGAAAFQMEVRQVDDHKFIDREGNLHTQKGLCVHDNPGFWNRVSLGMFDSMERGQ